MKTYWHYIILSLFSIVTLGLLYPVFEEGFISGHDNTSHYIYSFRLAEMMSEGNFRLWLPDFSMGMPLFHYYQPVPHVVTALVFLLFSGIEPLVLMKVIMVFLFAILPWSTYQSFRWMQLPRGICLTSALLVFSIQSWIGIGFELRSILGWGLYAQLWGMILAPLTIGYIYKSFFGERKLFVPVSLLGILFLTHVISGLIACMSIGLLFLLTKWDWKQKISDAFYLGKIYVGAFAIAAVLLVPNLLQGDYISGYYKLDEEHHLGIGFAKAVKYFFNGNILDYAVFPVLTVLTIAGILLYANSFLRKSKQAEAYILSTSAAFILCNFIMAFFLLAGAKTFTFLQYTPLYDNLPFLRLLGHFHFFCLPVIGVALVAFTRFLIKQYQVHKQKSRLKTAFVFAGLIPLIGIGIYLGYNQDRTFTRYAVSYGGQEETELNEALSFLNKQPEGRVNVTKIGGHAAYLPTIFSKKPIHRYYAAGTRSNLGQFYLHKFDNKNPDHYRLFAYNYLLTSREYEEFGKPIFTNSKYQIYKTGEEHHNYFDVVQSNTVVLSHNQPARHLFNYWMKHPETLDQKNHIAIADDHQESWLTEHGFSNFVTLKRKDTRLSASRFVLDNRKNDEQIESVIDMEDEGLGKYLNYQVGDLPEQGLSKVTDSYTEEGYYKAKIKVLSDETNTPQWAMLKVNAHPDWKAKVNGKPTEWIQMSPCFMAVQLEPGVHEVEFEFGVSSLRIALLVLSFFVIAGLGVWEKVLPRRKRLALPQLVTSK